MRPLTDHTPKPLLTVHGKPLIVWHLERLAAVGISDIVINHAWLGEQIEQTLGDGSQWGVRIQYSPESPALETAGGIARALPFLGPDPFLVINGDIWCDWPLAKAQRIASDLQLNPDTLAHLIMVSNPAHHLSGDFGLTQTSQMLTMTDPKLTFSGIGIYQPALFLTLDPDKPAPLGPLLRGAITTTSVRGEHYGGQWLDVGTPERLDELTKLLANR